jgi:hypothetical protein
MNCITNVGKLQTSMLLIRERLVKHPTSKEQYPGYGCSLVGGSTASHLMFARKWGVKKAEATMLTCRH